MKRRPGRLLELTTFRKVVNSKSRRRIPWVGHAEGMAHPVIKQQTFSMNKTILRALALFSGLAICSSPTIAQVSKSAINDFLNDSAVKTGHVGISIYDPATGKYLYNYNAEKNFLPSSNTKLFTLYAGMKYLGDSLVGMRYYKLNDSTTAVYGSGDPTFLHEDFIQQPVYNFLIEQDSLIIVNTWMAENRIAPGWAWDDYEEEFMPERSGFPIYGNLIRLFPEEGRVVTVPAVTALHLAHIGNGGVVHLHRDLATNTLAYHRDSKEQVKREYRIPMVTSDALKFLADTIHKKINPYSSLLTKRLDSAQEKKLITLYSRPVDSLFRPMMFNSDNFFAEQTLLMVSNERLGYMSDEDIIDTLLKTDFKDIPTKPRWVDGSGLSRYDLFSPKDFVYILVKLKNEFGQARMDRILPAGGEGTLTGYYGGGDYIHAKTGSMSNNVSLSGYLWTAKKKLLIFSVIINNFSGSGRSGRRAIEQFIQQIRATN